jgi:hypothetical protein
MPENKRKRFVWGMWFITWIGLLAGLFDRVFYEYVVVFSAVHALLVLFLLRFRISAFPAQVRVAYFAWVVIGTYAPYMVILMYITTVGLATNLFVGYCPLARTMYLFPWNREESFSLELIVRVFFSPPVVGQFIPRPSTG